MLPQSGGAFWPRSPRVRPLARKRRAPAPPPHVQPGRPQPTLALFVTGPVTSRAILLPAASQAVTKPVTTGPHRHPAATIDDMRPLIRRAIHWPVFTARTLPARVAAAARMRPARVAAWSLAALLALAAATAYGIALWKA